MEYLGQNLASDSHIVMLSHHEWDVMVRLAKKLVLPAEKEIGRMIDWKPFFSLCEAVTTGQSLTVTTTVSVNDNPFPMLDIELVTDC